MNLTVFPLGKIIIIYPNNPYIYIQLSFKCGFPAFMTSVYPVLIVSFPRRSLPGGAANDPTTWDKSRKPPESHRRRMVPLKIYIHIYIYIYIYKWLVIIVSYN